MDKKCTKCNIKKPLDNFWFNKKKQRHIAWCRECHSKEKIAYKEKHKEKLKEKHKEYMQTPEAKQKAKDRLKKHIEKIGREAWNERSRKWRKENPAKVKAQYAVEAKRLQELKDETFKTYGGYKCVCCGENNQKFLTIDHIDNNGGFHRKQMRLSGGVSHFYKWLKRNDYPNGYQVLCMNCNWGKGKNNGVCPHKFQGSETIHKGVGLSNPKSEALHKFGDEDIVQSAWRHAAAIMLSY